MAFFLLPYIQNTIFLHTRQQKTSIFVENRTTLFVIYVCFSFYFFLIYFFATKNDKIWYKNKHSEEHLFLPYRLLALFLFPFQPYYAKNGNDKQDARYNLGNAKWS